MTVPLGLMGLDCTTNTEILEYPDKDNQHLGSAANTVSSSSCIFVVLPVIDSNIVTDEENGFERLRTLSGVYQLNNCAGICRSISSLHVRIVAPAGMHIPYKKIISRALRGN